MIGKFPATGEGPMTKSATRAKMVEVLESWLATLPAEKTRHGYRHDCLTFLAYLDGVSAGGGAPGCDGAIINGAVVDGATVAAFRDHLAAAGRRPASVARCLSAVKGFCRALTRHGVPCEPAVQQVTIAGTAAATAAADRHPAPDHPSAPFGADMAARLVALASELSDDPWVAQRDVAIFSLQTQCGLGLGEILALTRGTDPPGAADSTLTVAGGRGRLRSVTIPAAVRHALAAYLALCPFPLGPGDPLFVGIRGGRLDPGVVQRQMRRLRARLGLPEGTTTSTLRKVFAASLGAAGADWEEVRRRLGHRHRSTTRRLCRPT